MDPRDFVLTAEQLKEYPSALESNFRSSISRGYYSVYLRIQVAVLNQAGQAILRQAQLSRQLSHEWLISALIISKTNEIALIGRRLANLRRARSSADYEMSGQVKDSDAAFHLENTKRLHAEIDAFGLPRIVAYLIQHIRDLAQMRTGNPQT